MVKAIISAVVLLFTLPALTFADAEVSAKLDLQNVITHDGSDTADPEWALSGTGIADLSIRSSGNGDVKGEVLIRGVLGSETSIDIQKAYIKARFPYFRIVAGKTALDWGEGFVFNAGDLISGTLPSVGLTALSEETFRTATDWLLSAYVPVGRFSFIEGVVLPPELDTGGDPPALASFSDLAAGARAQIRLGSVASELGYLFSGAARTHEVALSFQGNILVDWNVSASALLDLDTYDADSYWTEDLLDSVEVSLGLFQTIDSYAVGSMSFRVEALLMPGGAWEADPMANYGIILYGDVGWSPLSSLSAHVRTLYSPVDSSAFVSGGVSLGALPGFTAYITTGFQIGEDSDSFGSGRFADVIIGSGLRFSF